MPGPEKPQRVTGRKLERLRFIHRPERLERFNGVLISVKRQCRTVPAESFSVRVAPRKVSVGIRCFRSPQARSLDVTNNLKGLKKFCCRSCKSARENCFISYLASRESSLRWLYQSKACCVNIPVPLKTSSSPKTPFL